MEPRGSSGLMNMVAVTGDRVAALDPGNDVAGQALAGLAAVLRRYSDRSELLLGYANGTSHEPRLITLAVGDDPSLAELRDRAARALNQVVEPAPGAEPEAVVGIDRDPPVDVSYPLWLAFHEDAGAFHVALHGRSDGPAGQHAAQMLDHLHTLLEHSATAGDRPISELPLLSATQRSQLLEDFNRTDADYPYACLHELLSARARERAQHTAVTCGERSLTYAELEQRANRLARFLSDLGVGPEVLVGIAVSRSVDMLVGLLGVLKAGGAYVPVDPTYPAERQEFMLRSAQASVVLTERALADELPVGAGVRVICLDRDWDLIEGTSDEPLDLPCSPGQLAYVIYTSGSTGQPKGVQISHQALVNFLCTMRETPGLSAEDVLVAVTTLSFDIAGLELYLPLLVGAQVVIAQAETAADPRALAALLESSQATVMQATPTTWRMLLDTGWTPARPLTALCGGEPLPVALADRLVDREVNLWNMYGPTETTIWSTCAPITTHGETLTIGRPIANTSLYILDRHLEPVPLGVAGELWIGGDGLARGYRGRDDLTTERFVPSPFREGERIYRTGDLARYRPNGEVEFLGRIDNQVKVRGYRIELGEIETTLTRHPEIVEAVVTAHIDADGAAQLAAYVIPQGEPVPTHVLREFVGQSLPAYMVPLTVSTLEAFPLTPNGKVDRNALPPPTRERSEEHELVAPRTPLERRLAAIWERELQISPIGASDNFFDLGVTSFVAASLFAAIEHELGSQLPLGAIFRAPTIETLAQLLESAGDGSRWTSLIPIQPQGSQAPIFCVHGGAGTILHLAALARRLGPDQPFYGLQQRGLYGGAPPCKTVEQMATHYLSEMRQVHPGGPWRLAGYCFGTIVAFELAKRLRAAGEEVEMVAMFNGPSPDWIRQYGWYGGQPSWRAKHALPPRQTVEQKRVIQRRRRLGAIRTVLERMPRALRRPGKLVSGAMWYTRMPRTRALLALGRPVPESLREEFFFQLHAKAELAYVAVPYEGEIILFYGEGLYDDPALGWSRLTSSGVRTLAVPGEHENNRQAMMEPAVGFVAERLQEYLDSATDPSSTTSVGPQ